MAEPGEPPLLEYATPRETLLVRPSPPPKSRLVFLRGQAVPRDSAGRGYLPDGPGSRILVLHPEGGVAGVIGGPDPEDGGLGLPLSAAATREGALFVVDVEHGEGLLYFDARGRYVGAAGPPVANPAVAAAPSGDLWAARSPYLLGLGADPDGAPLLWRFDPLKGTGVAIARAEPPGEPRFGRLANAGAVTVGPDGTGFFAFLLRNELRAYRPDGTLVWRSRRRLPAPGEGGREVPTNSLPLPAVTQALASGPDGLLYALTAGPARRIEVWDPESGALLRAASVPVGWTSFAVRADGSVWRAEEEAALAGAPSPERRPLPSLTLERFEGDSISLRDYRGRALLINVWASWCIPCREELPRLAELYRSVDRSRVEFLAISDDGDEEAARRFAAAFDLPFPLLLGNGRMQEVLGFEGLPYTIIADYRGRVAEEFLGFGSEASWRRLTGTLATEIERAVPVGPEDPPAGEEGGAGTADEHGGHQH